MLPFISLVPNHCLTTPTVFLDKHIWPLVATVTSSLVVREGIVWVSHLDMLHQQLFQPVFSAMAAVAKATRAAPLHYAGVLAIELFARSNTWLD